ncbi:MAG: hypothetical protein K0R54_2072 [Clostridiaceae bacterium]|jgi:hypothetical protein|nr:hypothetical protein [Clostridiaceae bacterium]
MEWLKKLIEETKKNEDGSINIEELMKSINTEFPKYAVPKATFNDINGQLKTANDTIDTLKKANKGNEDLQGKIEKYENTIETMKSDSEKQIKELLLKDKLRDAGVKDADYLIFKHGGVDKFNYDSTGNLIGLEETLKPYRESMAYNFITGKVETKYDPAGGDPPKAINPFAKETFNLTKQGELIKQDPVQARKLAEAAGKKVNF